MAKLLKTAQMITETLDSHGIRLADCRAQGYDNGANSAIFYPRGCHTLNFCGDDAAECISEAITYFRTILPIYTLFRCSPKRWETLANRIGRSLHGHYMARDGRIELSA